MTWWNILLAAALIGVATNFDNTGVGIAYGAVKIRIPYWVNAVINAIGLIFVSVGAFAGDFMSRFLSNQVATWLSSFVLITIGLVGWYIAYAHHRIHPNRERIRLRQPGWHEAVALGFALSLTNLVNGMGSTVSDKAMLWPTIIGVTVVGYLAIWVGNIVGVGLLARWLGKYAAFIAGLILIGIGVHELYSQ